MNNWEYYSGDANSGPYGYYKGFFVYWKLSEKDELHFELKPDHNATSPADKDSACRFVSRWLTEQLSYKNSHPLNQIRTAFLIFHKR